MSADLLALLDQLDEARAAATPGPWRAVESGDSGNRYHAMRADVDISVVTAWTEPDAALIVAAVNAQPKLTAALRAVEAAVDEWEKTGQRGGDPVLSRRLVVAVLRGAITDALTPEPVQP